jgi:hypothetical protein
VPSRDTRAPTLTDRGISRDQSSRWQKLADVPEEQFEAALAAHPFLSLMLEPPPFSAMNRTSGVLYSVVTLRW